MKTLYNILYNSYFNKKNIIKEWNTPNVKSNETLVIFSHFDNTQTISPYIIYNLEKLHEQNCSIIFVSTSENLKAKEVDKIKKYCFKIISRKNIGLDFGSWKIGLESIKNDIHDFNSIVFVNDSCYFPAFNMTELFNDFKNKVDAISGVTFNTETHRKPHLQSYFLWVNNDNFNFCIDFFKNVRFFKNKRKIIKKYEVGFTQLAIKKNISINYWVNDTLYINKNPTIHFALELLTKKQSPFIKRAIFKNKESTHSQELILSEISKTNPELFILMTNQSAV